MFDKFERDLLDDAWKQMSEKNVQKRLCIFKELRKTGLNNERWFEWELFYCLLTTSRVNRDWDKDKKNRRKNRDRGDGVDLQFSKQNRFVELKTIATEKGNMNWIMGGFKNDDVDLVLFLALNHENLKKRLEECKINDGKIRYKEKDYEIKIKEINPDWIVGIIKEAKQ